MTPVEPLGRFLAVVETGIGFGFLAVVISYLPVLYQAFSRREVTISLLDARAGSPPTAAHAPEPARPGAATSTLLDRFLDEWERWAAEVLESHLSFPVLSYYRSQHDNQSWLAALTAILDTSALVIAGVQEEDRSQARLTFAMARHVVVDLAQVFHVPPVEPDGRPPARRAPGRPCRDYLGRRGSSSATARPSSSRLAELRGMYEPFVNALSLRFLLPLPPVFPDGEPVDNWQTSAWMRRTRGFRHLAADRGRSTSMRIDAACPGSDFHVCASPPALSEVDLLDDPRAVGQRVRGTSGRRAWSARAGRGSRRCRGRSCVRIRRPKPCLSLMTASGTWYSTNGLPPRRRIVLEAGLEQRMAGDAEREADDDHVRERLAGHVDPLPEAVGAEDHAVDVGLERLDHLRPRHAVALGEEGDVPLGEPGGQRPRPRRRASCTT